MKTVITLCAAIVLLGGCATSVPPNTQAMTDMDGRPIYPPTSTVGTGIGLSFGFGSWGHGSGAAIGIGTGW